MAEFGSRAQPLSSAKTGAVHRNVTANICAVHVGDAVLDF